MTDKDQSGNSFTVLAVGAHPDDIEFAMAGTLLRLKAAGARIHMWNLGSGSGGTATMARDKIVSLRRQEACDAAALAGATMHPSIADDFYIFYERQLMQRVSAGIRAIQPDMILTHSLDDYMEDHQNTARLVVTGAFSRISINLVTDPPQPIWDGNTTIYHAMPHGLRDNMRRRVMAEAYVDVTPYMSEKRALLACHRSQKEWLDQTQGMDAYLDDMERYARRVGRQSQRFQAAEGWRRHSALGFGPLTADPMAERLAADYHIDPAYTTWLNNPIQGGPQNVTTDQ